MSLEKPKRLFFWDRKVYFSYRLKYNTGSTHAGIPMHGWDEHFVFIGIDNKWLDASSFYYDAHCSKTYTFFGIIVGKGFTYSWEKQQ